MQILSILDENFKFHNLQQDVKLQNVYLYISMYVSKYIGKKSIATKKKLANVFPYHKNLELFNSRYYRKVSKFLYFYDSFIFSIRRNMQTCELWPNISGNDSI